jgi:hypothetical protein
MNEYGCGYEIRQITNLHDSVVIQRIKENPAYSGASVIIKSDLESV